jgi:hypothetical protein
MRSCGKVLLAWLACPAIGLLIAQGVRADGPEQQEKAVYVFKPELRRVMRQVEHNEFHLGHLDEWGNFLPDFQKGPLKWEKAGHLQKDYPLYNTQTGIRQDPVFEYRSGSLIPGFFLGFVFYPQQGAKIITMDDYLKEYPSKNNLTGVGCWPIYNLPGKIVKKGEDGNGKR